MLIGYARVSTYDQNLDLQKDALKQERAEQAGCTRRLAAQSRCETESAMTVPDIQIALEAVEAGDARALESLPNVNPAEAHRDERTMAPYGGRSVCPGESRPGPETQPLPLPEEFPATAATQTRSLTDSQEDAVPQTSHIVGGRILLATLAALSLLGSLPSVAGAHKAAELDPGKTMRAVSVGAKPPRIDGRLDDEVWSRAPVHTGLTQKVPDDGEPATERTFIQFAYDSDALYVAMALHYSDPGLITDNLTRRDQTYGVDRFRVEIDTHHDHQTAFMFELSAAGVHRDGHVTKNGDGFDGNWDAVWEGRVAKNAEGLSAEWRIPYQALRFRPADRYIWGVTVVRSIALKHEFDHWTRAPRHERGWVSRFGHLVGIEGISPARALELLPYAVGRTILYPGSDRDADLTARVGFDVRYGVSNSTSLSATINPDFGQVEADPAELNLTVFETFQAERRPFFVEGAQMFRTPIDLFYSRRLGRRPGLLSVPAGWDEGNRPGSTTVLGALKLTGKTGAHTTFGLMDAVTAGEHVRIDSAGIGRQALVEPRTNYVVGRLMQDVLKNSYVGILATALTREHGDEAWSAGVDWKLNSEDNDYEFAGQVATSHTNRGNGWAVDVEAGKRTGLWQAEAGVEAFSPDFEINDMGFLRQSDIYEPRLELEYENQDPWKMLRSTSIWMDGWRRWNSDETTLEDAVGWGVWMGFLNYMGLGGGYTHRFRASDDRDTRGGPVIATPASGDYWVSAETDWRQPTSVWANLDWGSDRAGSTRRRLGAGVAFKPVAYLEVRLGPSYSWNHADAQWIDNVDDNGDGTPDHFVYGRLESKTLDLTTRASIILNPRLSLEAYVQPFVTAGEYDGFKELAAPDTYRFTPYGEPDESPDFRRRSLRSNIVLRWEYRPGSTLFLVWSQDRSDASSDPRLRPLRNLGDSFADAGTNVLFVKASYWFSP